MKRIGQFLLNILSNPLSTTAGLGGISTIGVAAYRNPSVLAQPANIAVLITSIGLLLAADAKGKGKADAEYMAGIQPTLPVVPTVMPMPPSSEIEKK